ncbi:MAG: hypothetical protein WHS65_06845 [Melioribacteraceae bacterium]
MSLLPIIYTSLILFFGLMMIVIIISYISYKIKAEKNPVIEEEIKKMNQLNMPQRIIKPNPAVNVVQVNKNEAPNYQLQYRKNNNKNYDSKKTAYNNTKPRIEIMNFNPAFKKNEIQNKKEINRRLEKQYSHETYQPDKSKINLLNYYTDNDEELVNLKIMPVTR